MLSDYFVKKIIKKCSLNVIFFNFSLAYSVFQKVQKINKKNDGHFKNVFLSERWFFISSNEGER